MQHLRRDRTEQQSAKRAATVSRQRNEIRRIISGIVTNDSGRLSVDNESFNDKFVQHRFSEERNLWFRVFHKPFAPCERGRSIRRKNIRVVADRMQQGHLAFEAASDGGHLRRRIHAPLGEIDREEDIRE
jgi:hypothetical protein